MNEPHDAGTHEPLPAIWADSSTATDPRSRNAHAPKRHACSPPAYFQTSTAPGRQRRWMVDTNNIELTDSHADEFAVDEMVSRQSGPHDARTSTALQRRILPAPARCMHSQTAITWTARANLTRKLAIPNLTYRSLDAGAIMAVARPGAWIKPAPPPPPPPPPPLVVAPPAEAEIPLLLRIPAEPSPPRPPD